MSTTTPHRVIHMERATIVIEGIGSITTPRFTSRSVAAQKRASLQEAVKREARMLGTSPKRVKRPRFIPILAFFEDQ